MSKWDKNIIQRLLKDKLFISSKNKENIIKFPFNFCANKANRYN